MRLAAINKMLQTNRQHAAAQTPLGQFAADAADAADLLAACLPCRDAAEE